MLRTTHRGVGLLLFLSSDETSFELRCDLRTSPPSNAVPATENALATADSAAGWNPGDRRQYQTQRCKMLQSTLLCGVLLRHRESGDYSFYTFGHYCRCNIWTERLQNTWCLRFWSCAVIALNSTKLRVFADGIAPSTLATGPQLTSRHSDVSLETPTSLKSSHLAASM